MSEKLQFKLHDLMEIITDEKSYKSRVIDIEEDSIKIDMPVKNGEYLFLYNGDKIEANSILKNDKYYNYNCNVLGKGRENNIIYYKLSLPYNVKRIQRREFFRVELTENVTYKKLNADNSISEHSAIILDMSGGGLKILARENLNIKDIIIVDKVINNNSKSLKCEVVRTDEMNNQVYGLKFLDLSDSEVDELIKEIFEITRKRNSRI